jgi:hypothetical protein
LNWTETSAGVSYDALCHDGPMLVNSTVLMYGAFMRARHADPRTGPAVAILNDVLDLVSQQRRLVVIVPDALFTALDKRRMIQAMAYGQRRAATDELSCDELSAANADLFSLIRAGACELQRLWEIQASDAVRAVGYALHALPDLLRAPFEFSPDEYQECFHLVGQHWEQLSVQMRLALSHSIGMNLTEAEALLNQG